MSFLLLLFLLFLSLFFFFSFLLIHSSYYRVSSKYTSSLTSIFRILGFLVIFLDFLSNTLLLTNRMSISHNSLAKGMKLCSSKWLCHVICNHGIRWAVLNCYFLPLDQVGNVKIFDVEMSCPFSTTLPSAFLKFHRASIVLVDNVRSNIDSLRFHESSCPKHL